MSELCNNRGARLIVLLCLPHCASHISLLAASANIVADHTLCLPNGINLLLVPALRNNRQWLMGDGAREGTEKGDSARK